MPSAPPLARSSPRAKTLRTPILLAIAAVAAAALLIVLLSSVLTDPERVSVTVENPTVYNLNVRVRPADGGSVLSLGPVSSESTRTYNGVLDQGEEWYIEFLYSGTVAGDVTLSREQVESGSVMVPASAEDVLREAGVEPPPP